MSKPQTRKKVIKYFLTSSSSDDDDIPVPSKRRKLTTKKPSLKSETKVKVEDDTTTSNYNLDLLTSSDKVPVLNKRRKLPIRKPSLKPKIEVKVENDTTTANYNLKPVNSSTQTRKSDSKAKLEPSWKVEDLIKEEHNVSSTVTRNLINLFEEGNTIPFIARYRKDAVGQMSADELRKIKHTYVNTLELKQKVIGAYGKIQSLGKMNHQLERALLDVRNFDSLDEIYGPIKQEGESAKKKIHATLDQAADMILSGKNDFSLQEYMGKAKGLESMEIIKKEVIHVLAKKLSVTMQSLQFLNKLKKEASCSLETKKIRKREKVKEENLKHKVKNNSMDSSKYETYYDKKYHLKYLKPYQILAINRAEHHKFLNVTLHFNDFSNNFCYETWKSWDFMRNSKFQQLFAKAISECYHGVLIPLLKRTKRSELKSYAERQSLEIFSLNLKQMLLATPVKGKKILGVDPGFTHGCKLGVISENGSVLATEVVYPHNAHPQKIKAHEKVFRDLLLEHECSLIALGNGTACRETEAWISSMISRGMFEPLEVSYTIVNESGASIYSCSKEAIKEFNYLDPNKISAVCLARRVQDPLAELVKVEPKHLGIGMYQHDMNQKRLEEALSDVVSECVSFVGVDLNTASQCLLKYVAGLTDKRASEIISYRESKGSFTTRQELLKVKGLGPLSFKQCAGFLKIFNGTNKLEITSVHPESYDVAKKILKSLHLRLDDVGSEEFTKIIKSKQKELLEKYDQFCDHKGTLDTILEALSETINYDLRDKVDQKPLFRNGTTNIEFLEIGMKLTGSVNNVTSFGSFVDIGVGINGLIHFTNSNGVELRHGDRVEVCIMALDLNRKRISLQLIQKF